LGGLSGADKICQSEADQLNLSGTWQAFLGGDTAEETAMQRLAQGPRKSDGVFVSSQIAGTLINGLTCHRFLGQGFSSVLSRFLTPSLVVAKQSDTAFMESLAGVWLGRIDDKSRDSCTPIQSLLSSNDKALREKYSSTVTCQDWKVELGVISNPGADGSPLPSCYTSQGKYTTAIGIAGLSSIKTDGSQSYLSYTQGDLCSSKKKLICVEE
jgi:hypothetical protein